jgi:hypothetical protein
MVSPSCNREWISSVVRWLILTPKSHIYVITDAYIPTLDGQNSSTSLHQARNTSSILLNLQFSNPNKKMGIYYVQQYQRNIILQGCCHCFQSLPVGVLPRLQKHNSISSACDCWSPTVTETSEMSYKRNNLVEGFLGKCMLSNIRYSVTRQSITGY